MASRITFFDTETTGLPLRWGAPVTDLGNWPRLVQVAWIMANVDGSEVARQSFIIRPDGFVIPKEIAAIHGITNERALAEGLPIREVLGLFDEAVEQSDCLVAHNMSFDEAIMGAEFLRHQMANSIATKKKICTKDASTNFCAISSPNGFKDFKWPKLSELHVKLFGIDFEGAHNAATDVLATAKCFWELRRRGVIS